MAKNDNLKDFLTDVADAIRAKKGSTGLINPQNFSAEIASIETGGGGDAVAVVEKDVNFRDYDGTLLYSFTKAQLLSMTELPELPSRPGLVCQGWNWTLEQAQDKINDIEKIEIGANYKTDDDTTRLYITLEIGMDIPLNFSQSVSDGVAINWGDGSAEETIAATGYTSITHHYADGGSYVIKLRATEGCTLILGANSTSQCVLGAFANANLAAPNSLRKVECADSVAFSKYAFAKCYSLSTITLPQSATLSSSLTYLFQYAYSLKYLAIPYGTSSIPAYLCHHCYSLANISLPRAAISMDEFAFSECTSLTKITFPVSYSAKSLLKNCRSLQRVYGYASGSESTLSGCYALHSFKCVVNSTTIDKYFAKYCYCLTYVKFAVKLKTIGGSAFSSCYNIRVLDFRDTEAVPTLSYVNAFEYVPTTCIFVVPDALYDEWIAATNWATYAAQIVKASEYTD